MDTGLARTLIKEKPDTSSVLTALRNVLGLGSTEAALRRTQETERTSGELFGNTKAKPQTTSWNNNSIYKLTPERMKEMGL